MSEDDGRELRLRRAEKEQDCRIVSVRDVLAATIEEIDRGELKADQVVIILGKDLHGDVLDEKARITSRHAGTTRSQHLTLLELHKTLYMANWANII